jgi:hypothetical protein
MVKFTKAEFAAMEASKARDMAEIREHLRVLNEAVNAFVAGIEAGGFPNDDHRERAKQAMYGLKRKGVLGFER